MDNNAAVILYFVPMTQIGESGVFSGL